MEAVLGFPTGMVRMRRVFGSSCSTDASTWLTRQTEPAPTARALGVRLPSGIRLTTRPLPGSNSSSFWLSTPMLQLPHVKTQTLWSPTATALGPAVSPVSSRRYDCVRSPTAPVLIEKSQLAPVHAAGKLAISSCSLANAPIQAAPSPKAIDVV